MKYYNERRVSRKARKAIVKQLYVPIDAEELTYDDGYEIEGGAVLQIAGVCGAVVSFVCNAVLWMNKQFKWGINWFWRCVLKVSAVVGDIVSIAAGIGNLIQGSLFNITAKILSKVGLGAKAANGIAAGWKAYATAKHISRLLDI